ncbi:MAG: DUF4126 family protein [Bryobacteraceae bacterium]|nr:DUF4126 family protein [Bryobacteraceae bacterium]
MNTYQLAFLIGAVAGLRSTIAPAAISWAARSGGLRLENSGLDLLGSGPAPYILSLLAAGELIVDKHPKVPSRKAAGPFIVRILSGALCGAAIGTSRQAAAGGFLAGAFGGAAGTLAGFESRSQLVRAAGGNDLPIALLEDAVAIGGAFLTVSQASRNASTP